MKVREIKNCSRCTTNHDELEAHPFTNPIELPGMKYEYWAVCPVTAEPIIVSVQLVSE